MKCRRCKAVAVAALPSHNTAFCGPCFIRFFTGQVEKAIRKHGLARPGERVLTALSGGKDSLALARVLAELGFHVTGLHVDLAIPGSSEIARAAVEAFCARHGLDLVVADMREQGLEIPRVREAVRRPICSACGGVKRYFMNKTALDLGFDVLATGHNLDDETARLFANTLRWDAAYLSDQGPYLPAERGFARKVKPLYRLTEFETAVYCHLMDIEHVHAPCPYARGASFTAHKALLSRLEKNSPGSRIAFYEGFLHKGRPAFEALERESGPELSPCSECGYPTSAEVCSVCRLRAMVREAGA